MRSSGGVTKRNMAIDVSEEIARKDQELGEMTRDVDLIKVDVDIIAIRRRGAPAGAEAEDAAETCIARRATAFYEATMEVPHAPSR
jgi:hypothetical protein